MKQGVAEICVVVGWVLSALALVHLVVYMPSADELHYNTHILFSSVALLFVALIPLFVFRHAKIRWSILDFFWLLLTVLYLFSAFVNDKDISFVTLQEAFPYIALYFLIKIFVSIGGEYSNRFIVVLFSISLCFESVLGLMQVFGYKLSGSAMFGMTGSFQNPGPFGGYVAILMSVVMVPVLRFCIMKDGDTNFINGRWAGKVVLFLFCIALLLGMMVLPASQSRAGWLAFGGALLLFAFVEGNLWIWVRKHWSVSVLLSVAIIILLVGVFCFKKESALGRLHIWYIEMLAIASKPFLGAGSGMALGAYGKAQKNFFMAGADNVMNAGIAGCPEYAFNEFLKVGMESGVMGLILALMIVTTSVIFLLKERNVLAYGLFAAAIFSFFSYPLSLVRISVVIVIMFAVSSCRKSLLSILPVFLSFFILVGLIVLKNVYKDRSEAVLSWLDSRQLVGMEIYEESVDELSKLHVELFWNYRYLYDYGYVLHRLGRYEKSNLILKEGAEISSDPMFYNIIGKNYVGLCEFDRAEQAYNQSHYIVPGRLYPLVLLMEMYYSIGKKSDALSLGNRILDMPVNENNVAMQELYNRVYNQILKWKSDDSVSSFVYENNERNSVLSEKYSLN